MNAYPIGKITGTGDSRRVTVRHGRRRYIFDLLRRHEPEVITDTPGGQSRWEVALPGQRHGDQVYADAVTPQSMYVPNTQHAPVQSYATAEEAAHAAVADIVSGCVPTRWGTWSQ